MNGDILKKLRKENGLSQIELSKKLNVTQGTIARIEANSREPGKELTKKIAEFFNVSIDYLEGLTTTKEDDKSLVKNLLIHLYNAGIIKDINNIDETTTDMIMGMVKKELELIAKEKKNC